MNSELETYASLLFSYEDGIGDLSLQNNENMWILPSLMNQPLRRIPSMCSWCKKFHKTFSSATVTEDKYNGVTVDLSSSQSLNSEDFKHILSDSLQKWRREGKTAVWIRVPILLSHLIPDAANQGFQFHHAEYGQSLLKLWLDESKEDLTPQFATHQVGVSGMVIREDTGQVLAVQDRNSRFNLWKFPGGLSNLEEDICDTAVREVFEETGIEAEFQSVLALRQQHRQPGAFGRLTSMAIYGVEHGFQDLDITYEEMKSVYKGLRYKLYHRPIPANRRTD